MIDDQTRRDALALLRFIVEKNIQRLFQPFVSMQQLIAVAVAVGPMPNALRDVITAGEQLRITSVVETFFKRLPNCRLHNQYGPSESHVVTAYTLQGEPQTWPRLPAIGKPIAHTEVFIVDEQLQAVVDGQEGECLIAGVCLADGYFGRADLTSEKFINTEQYGRVYRTGDLVRRESDGNIAYLGRIDGQVKIRGHRIELGEIETVLAKHAGVKDIALLAHGDSSGERKLIAYAVAHADFRHQSGKLMTQLWELGAAHLPEYMLPARFIFLDAMPLTPSGKLDRRALPVPNRQRPELEQSFIGAQSVTEKKLSEIWQHLLDLDDVGIRDNFFELGGNSLLTLRMGLAITEQLQLELSVAKLFQYPTIQTLASYIEQGQQSHPGEQASATQQLKTSAQLRAEKQKQAFAKGRAFKK